MDARLRVLALFEDDTPLVLKPCHTVTISGQRHQLDSKHLIRNLVQYSSSPIELIDTILTSFPQGKCYGSAAILLQSSDDHVA
jgi:hypothetical protein